MSIVENGDHIRLYYHMDYLGTADYLTSPVSGKVESWTHYNEWGEIVHNAVLKCGQRELDLVKRYATHDYDAVLDLYYAKARMYDAANRQFMAVDPILDPSEYDLKEYVRTPVMLVQYLYVKNGPLVYVDPLGQFFIYRGKDKDGNTYYTIEKGNVVDTFFSSIIAPDVNWASFIHEGLSWIDVIKGTSAYGETLIGGTSDLREPDWFEDFKTIYSVEFEQAVTALEQYIVTFPGGAIVVSGIEALREVGPIVVDIYTNVPKQWSISDRDRIILKVMEDAGIATKRNYSPNFYTGAYLADAFVQENLWFFQEQSTLSGFSAYELGRAYSQGADTDPKYDKVKDQVRRQFRSNIEMQIINTLTFEGPDGRLIGPVESMLSEIRQLATKYAYIVAAQYFEELQRNYETTIDYFQNCFCETPSN